jgi:hypothetical protein
MAFMSSASSLQVARMTAKGQPDKTTVTQFVVVRFVSLLYQASDCDREFIFVTETS